MRLRFGKSSDFTPFNILISPHLCSVNTRLRKFRTYLTRPNNRLRLKVIFGSCHGELSSLRRSLPTMAAGDGRAIAKRPTRLALFTFWPLRQKLRSAEFPKPCIHRTQVRRNQNVERSEVRAFSEAQAHRKR